MTWLSWLLLYLLATSAFMAWFHAAVGDKTEEEQRLEDEEQAEYLRRRRKERDR